MNNNSSSNRCKIVSWNATAFWIWDTSTNDCGICRNHMMNSCVECINKNNKEIDSNCKIVTGECGCSYHYHCIDNWYKTNNNCPLHNTEWKYNQS